MHYEQPVSQTGIFLNEREFELFIRGVERDNGTRGYIYDEEVDYEGAQQLMFGYAEINVIDKPNPKSLSF